MSNGLVERCAADVVDAAVTIHRQVGPGMLESAYESMMQYELVARGLSIERQKYVNLIYKSLVVERAYCVDLLVEQCVVVEVKSVEAVAPVHLRQVLTYLKCMNLQTGFLINFGQTSIKSGGLRRIMNGYPVRTNP